MGPMTAEPRRYGTWEATPWARALIPEGGGRAISHRIPAGRTLWLSVSSANHAIVIGKLTGHGLPVEARGSLEQVLAVLLP